MKRLGLIAIMVFGGLLFSISFELPDLGDARSPASTHVSPYYIEQAIHDTSVPNVVTAILADYRGYDTLFETAVIFSAGLATFALVMVLAGRWQARVGPRRMSLAGGLLLGLGFVLGGLFGSTFWAQFLFIGVVAGAGIGLALVKQAQNDSAAADRAIQTARQITSGQVIVAFGSAGLRDREKRRLMSEIAAGWTERGSSSRITKSASFPGSRLPITSSEWHCQAAVDVIARMAASTETRSSGASTVSGSFHRSRATATRILWSVPNGDTGASVCILHGMPARSTLAQRSNKRTFSDPKTRSRIT
mgnify:CR=1 FL=1